MHRRYKPTYEYVIYKGDEVVCAGSRREILEKMGMSGGQFDSLTSSKTLEKEMTSERLHGGTMVAVKVSRREIEKESQEDTINE
ncbi:hypothetical protein [Staphylococcus pseudoxylosus]|uniref:hypothetical protein n=1 Tax=Staphylococcus pseudoxylosus TaxID=2282419 RepID=UPI000D1F21F5|nr:hypothetical protein [Staphylococcus pseudoxylosus]MBM2657577.1 hypothetical protein [Staphylococcus pseudoxylosus]MEB5782421.1 hypothetical protein [Staphylococcus pseudoxylosus]PTI83651.1 hypothetical protein BU098_01850 [Staphylococcus xylosus]